MHLGVTPVSTHHLPRSAPCAGIASHACFAKTLCMVCSLSGPVSTSTALEPEGPKQQIQLPYYDSAQDPLVSNAARQQLPCQCWLELKLQILLQAFIYERAQTFTDLPSIYRRRPIEELDIAEASLVSSQPCARHCPDNITSTCTTSQSTLSNQFCLVLMKHAQSLPLLLASACLFSPRLNWLDTLDCSIA